MTKQNDAGIEKRGKIESIDELKAKGLSIIDEDDVMVETNIEEILKEKDLLVSDLAKLTGISRQNINAVLKNKMKPGIDFALKVSYVLGLPVEEVFSLTENAWMKPLKDVKERDSTLYLDVVHLEIVDNKVKKQAISETGHEYYNQKTGEFVTRDEHANRLRDFLDEQTPAKMDELRKENHGTSENKLLSLAKEELRREFGDVYTKIYKKLGEPITPYVINPKRR